ncbi:hypothetical protein E4U36_008086 [Claviceps purpurea]|nr:hypothetical protein E4U36_008086 [Claviceps purpurea]
MAQFYYVYSRLGTFQTTFLPYVTRATDSNHQPAAFFLRTSATRSGRLTRSDDLNLVKMRQGQHESLHAYTSRVGSVLSSKQVRNTFRPRRPACATSPRHDWTEKSGSCLRGLYGTPLGIRR